MKKVKEEEKLSGMMLTKKRKRLLDKIKNCDKDKREKIMKLIKRKKQIRKSKNK